MSQALKCISEQNTDLCLNTYILVMVKKKKRIIYTYIHARNKLEDEYYEKKENVVPVKGE